MPHWFLVGVHIHLSQWQLSPNAVFCNTEGSEQVYRISEPDIQ